MLMTLSSHPHLMVYTVTFLVRVEIVIKGYLEMPGLESRTSQTTDKWDTTDLFQGLGSSHHWYHCPWTIQPRLSLGIELSPSILWHYWLLCMLGWTTPGIPQIIWLSLHHPVNLYMPHPLKVGRRRRRRGWGWRRRSRSRRSRSRKTLEPAFHQNKIILLLFLLLVFVKTLLGCEDTTAFKTGSLLSLFTC